MPADKAQALEAGGDGDAGGSTPASEIDVGDGLLLEEPSDSEDNDVALQSGKSADPIVDWTDSGTCQWMIDAAGCLIVKPKDGLGTGELGPWTYSSTLDVDVPPWYSYRESVVSARFERKSNTKPSRYEFHAPLPQTSRE